MSEAKTSENKEQQATAIEVQVSEILRPTLHDNDFLQSFVRIGLEDTKGDKECSEESSRSKDTCPSDRISKLAKDEEKMVRSASRGISERKLNSRFVRETLDMEMKEQRSRKRRRPRSDIIIREEEVYTDKDRAAAVNMGSRDIKQSLKIKRRQDRRRILHIPEEADPNAMLALGNRELRCGNVATAINCVNKALELSPNDKKALIARSKCYLLLGEADKALQDAETALEGNLKDVDKSRAIYCKAEALYHLGDFEMSLVYYYRGTNIRPEFDQFRLGVQKAKEAIQSILNKHSIPIPSQEHIKISKRGSQSTLGTKTRKIVTKVIATDQKILSSFKQDKKEQGSFMTKKDAREETERSMTPKHKKYEPSLLGQLNVDKKYLQNLLKQPDIKVGHQDSAQHIMVHAEEGIAFLKTRQEFWRQQRAVQRQSSNKK